MRTLAALGAALSLLWPAVPVSDVSPSAASAETAQIIEGAIDALSVTLPSRDATAQVSYRSAEGWSDWQTLTVESEQDPATRESNLVVFPRGTQEVRIQGEVAAIHPLDISEEPVRTLLAATEMPRGMRIISRREWGANDELLFTSASAPDVPVEDREQGNGSSSSASSATNRITDCEQAQLNYPSEFKVARTETHENEKRLRWERQYSKNVRLLVVHHTAIKVDDRSGIERVRALYEYHAQNRGWGDVGYHFLIDEDGKIYEGKSGGDFVVGGHVYCNNISSIGVALLGNFEVEKPTQTQVKSLQWLLDELAGRYDIDLSREVRFHGKQLPPILGHRDLLSTECPGYYLHGVLSQVRTHVERGDLMAAVKFPAAPRRSSNSARSRAPVVPLDKEGVSALGATTISARPGAEVALSVRYRAGAAIARRGSVIARVSRSEPTLEVWQEQSGSFVPVTNELLLPTIVPPKGTTQIRLKVRLPIAEGGYRLTIGDVQFLLEAQGRRVRGPRRDPVPADQLPKPPRNRPLPLRSSRSSQGGATGDATSRGALGTDRVTLPNGGTIRIRLTYDLDGATLQLPQGTLVNATPLQGTSVFLFREDEHCIAAVGRERIATGIIRLDPQGGITTIATLDRLTNRYRGVLECRVIGGRLTLINELPLEDYLAGLAEEPDTEPFEKQRAFAIAARSYAAYYLDPAHRKFPGLPFDGSDSPEEFQAYGGVVFEEKNPAWVRAVRETDREVLVYQGDIIRAPYFSASNGRTRTPAEAGWKDFPHPEVFASKPDPWCNGMQRRGHGVGMSGCGAEGQANEGKTAEQILAYYYPSTRIVKVR